MTLIDRDLLADCKVPARLSTPPLCSSKLSEAFVLPNGAQIWMFGNKKKTFIQINPSQWSCAEAILGFLSRLCSSNYNKLRVTREDFNVKIPLSYKTLIQSAKVSKKILFSKGQTDYEKPRTVKDCRGAKVLGLTFGSKKTGWVKVYDAEEMHGLPGPCSEIEITNRARRTRYLDHPDDLYTLNDKLHFANYVGLWTVTPKQNLTKKQKILLTTFESLRQIDGLSQAIKTMRSTNPNYDRDIKKVMEMKPLPIDLDANFKEGLDNFLSTPINEVEFEIAFDTTPLQRLSDYRTSRIRQPNFDTRINLTKRTLQRSVDSLISSTVRTFRDKKSLAALALGKLDTRSLDLRNKIVLRKFMDLLLLVSEDAEKSLHSEGFEALCPDLYESEQCLDSGNNSDTGLIHDWKYETDPAIEGFLWEN